MGKEKEKEQPIIFDEGNDPVNWKEDWKDMPEFIQKDESSFQSIIVHFENKEDMDAFAKLVGQNITHRTKSIWYPKYNRERPSNYIYAQEGE